MKNLKIAIIDCIGLNYDGTTLQKKGIGGSESSIISVAKELVKIGFDVSIFNDCDTHETSPGIYDGVHYRPVQALGQHDFGFDIVISQRTIIPFTPISLYDQVRQPSPRDYDPNIFKQVQKPQQLKIVWMQDTFIWGDHLLEHLVVNNWVDEIFNLSDWHISYTTNSSHGPKRQYEALKNKIFHTRNAINRWIDWVDVKQKDPNLFVYNASITKGMVPLIQRIWPRLKQHLPQAKLKVIGGYYKFRTEDLSPAQQEWVALMNSCAHDPSIEFTGIIPQPEIAKIMAKASYNLFPGAYPETSGISSIESINYNTPIIGTRFGAMEESATEAASYFIDYAIEPNSLFPWININDQVNKYVDLVLQVVGNPYLHQQKQYACNAIKDVSTWDTVALQWKQHFFRKFKYTMDPLELEQVQWINYRVRKTFGKRFANIEDVIVTEPAKNLEPIQPPRKVRVAYIDIVGISYDGDTLNHKGLGGSESAVILSSRELAKLGVDVTVYCACDEENHRPGVYDGVTYRPLSDIGTDNQRYDVLIASRVVTPFVTKPWYGWQQTTNRTIPFERFEQLRANASLKVFWMHDTFCWGDDILEDLVVAGAIDEIWTLSDFHANYVMNCAHGKLRNHEVLRKRMWTTRNGMTKYFDSCDIKAKDPSLFMFNANMSKGLEPLLNSVWPRVKQRIPQARLVVIGGHYKLGNAVAVDTEATEFMKIAGPHLEDPTINFTGIISQQEVAGWCQKSSFFIYPTAFPETYSISTLEALYANTLMLTCRFGALEETASPHSYMIDYSLTPNSVYPNVDRELQTQKFVNMVEAAYNDPTRRRRMAALDELKDLVGWDVVALEWKQHVYSKLELYLSRGEFRQANYTKTKYHKVFNRRMSTPEEWVAPKLKSEQRIVVVSPFYNAEPYINRCIASVAAQDYDNYEHWLINDSSTDNGYQTALDFINTLPTDIRHKFKIVSNLNRNGAPYNHIQSIKRLDDNDIVIMLDGDDSLKNSPDIFTYYNHIHHHYDFTYGSCWSMVDNIPLVSQPYPPEVKETGNYKNYKFNWNVPYTHLRTMKAHLLKNEPDSVFQDSEGKWFKAGGDLSTFYTALENCLPSRVYVVPDIVCNYNDASPINDYKVNKEEQDKAVNETLTNSNKGSFVIKNDIIDGVGPWVWSSHSDCSYDLIKNDWEKLKKVLVDNIVNWDSCVQAGGHQGMYPRLLANYFKTVYTFEPNSLSFEILDKNCKKDNIVKFNSAVGAYDQLVSFKNFDPNNTGVSSIDIGAEGTIPVVTIDSLNLKSCDLIQLDVERYEMYALIGAIKTITSFKPLIICEGPENTNHICTNLLEQLGYEKIDSFGDWNDTVYKYTGGISHLKKPSNRFAKKLEIPAAKQAYRSPPSKKRILIAVPTNRNIEAQTFKSIYDLIVPDGYEVDFQYFWGYQVDQVRNLIAHWIVQFNYDYLFAVDSDIAFAPDTLVKMLNHNVDIVSGIYIQRIPGTHTIEVMRKNEHGGVTHVNWNDIKGQGLVEIHGCGFGCVLVKGEVIRSIPYPHFLYHSALDHKNTLSEDVHFCNQARDRGFKLWADTSIICDHIGSWTFKVE